MITRNYFFIITFCLFQIAKSQTKNNLSERPKLVVGMVVDQMRWDYLYRYQAKYSTDGFARLLQKGYACENTYIPYIPTYTAPGHTCIYTGSVPAIHGIVGNDWYERNEQKTVYCTNDTAYKTIGSSSNTGRQSPKRLLTTTITDELRLATNFRSKTIALALKDRSSILPGGHTSNGSFFYDGKTGNFVTSSFYMDSLPSWMKGFNEKHLAEKYIKDNWNTLLEISKYAESTEDDKWYESKFSFEDKPVFPHAISTDLKKNFDIIRPTPFGNSITFEAAKAAVEGEHLGQGNWTDFLALSFSSTDHIGHAFGPNSIEMEDCYLRFDQDLAQFLNYLDKTIGKENYVLFLSADHGAAHCFGFNKENHIPSEVLLSDSFKKDLNQKLEEKFSTNELVKSFINMQLFLNKEKITTNNLNENAVRAYIKEYLLTKRDVSQVVNLQELSNETLPANMKSQIENGFYPKRSGDMQVIFRPAVVEDFPKGTTHGTGWAYDTHIPLIFYGWKIKPGKDYAPHAMTDIAATLAALLKIQEPNGNVGKVIQGVLNKK